MVTVIAAVVGFVVGAMVGKDKVTKEFQRLVAKIKAKTK